MEDRPNRRPDDLRVGQAAEILGVSTDTLRRWDAEGRLATFRTSGGQRRIRLAEVRRLLTERRGAGGSERSTARGSARNRFPGIVTRIERDGVVAVVEILAGPHRVVSLMTAEAVDDLGLNVGDEAVGVVKATAVVVEVPASRDPRS
jgi:molybdopterin-binding protein